MPGIDQTREVEPLFQVPHGAEDPLDAVRTLFARLLS